MKYSCAVDKEINRSRWDACCHDKRALVEDFEIWKTLNIKIRMSIKTCS
jgi:hypothetical protein